MRQFLLRDINLSRRALWVSNSRSTSSHLIFARALGRRKTARNRQLARFCTQSCSQVGQLLCRPLSNMVTECARCQEWASRLSRGVQLFYVQKATALELFSLEPHIDIVPQGLRG